jgi:hypothetical protein
MKSTKYCLKRGQRRGLREYNTGVKLFKIHIYGTITMKLPVLLMYANYKRQKITSIGKDVKKLTSVCTMKCKVKWCSCCGKHYGSSSKIKNRITI